MAEERVQRRLAAILAADMVGYSRLMEADEEGTIARQKAYRKDLIDPSITNHQGRIVKTTGDGLLIEFASVVDAVRCALEVQQGMAEHEGDKPEDRRIQYRVGVNLGDIVIDGEDILGEGVNIASRLEGLSEPGGICISRAAHDQIQGKLPLTVDDLGEHQVKNIARPVHVFQIRLDDPSSVAEPATDQSALTAPSEKPSIAVLPFDNMSGDPEQEFFADGITEDIITELSRFPGLFVIARNSSFTYKGRAVRMQDVGRELGVRYVAEGSVRKAGNRVRVTIQLIEAATGNHVWAERYDRELTDIFDLQDEITQTIVATLPGRLDTAEAERLRRKPPSDMAAYDCLLTAKILHHRITKEDNSEALRLLDKAIELDPDFAQSYAWKACTLGQAMARGYTDDVDTSWKEASTALQRAVALDENDVECHRILCEVNMSSRDWEAAELHHNRAFVLNPNDPRLAAQRGELLTWMGKAEEGAEWIRKAIRLDPYEAHLRAHLLGRSLYALRDYEGALSAFRQIPSPRYRHLADMAAISAQMGKADEAKALAAKVLELEPGFTITGYMEGLAYREDADRAHHLEGLRKSGLPE